MEPWHSSMALCPTGCGPHLGLPGGAAGAMKRSILTVSLPALVPRHWNSQRRKQRQRWYRGKSYLATSSVENGHTYGNK